MFKDTLQSFVFENINIRGEIVHLNQSFQLIMHQHQYPPLIRKILGEALAVATLLTGIIKFEGRLTVQFQGKDPLKLLLAQCDNEFHIRGLAQSQNSLLEKEINDALKNGILSIHIKSEAQPPYQGIVTWRGDSFAQSIEGYFKDSEQLLTRVWLASNEESIAGLLLQIMPTKNLPALEENHWEHVTCLTDTLTPAELLNVENADLLYKLYSQEEVRIFEPKPVTFSCTCSQSRSENAVYMLGKEEAEQELKGHQKIVVTCEFCNKEYVFDKIDVANIFKRHETPH